MSDQEKLNELRKIVEHQANIQTLWCPQVGISEAMLQAALRHLHCIIEDIPGEEYMAAQEKKIYWDLESEL